MTIHRHLRLVYVVGFAAMLAACSGQPESPTAPSTLSSAPPASVPGSSATGAATGGVTIASAPAPDSSASNFEIKFMTNMIDHHQMAVMMAEMCIAKAIHAELRSLCESIRTAQMAEIEEMQAWLQDWYGITYQPVMKPGDQQMMERLAALSGAEFEIAFMEMMIKHHEKAIKEGQHCLDKAYHAELRELCQTIITTQSAEIALMETWLCQWYGQCR
ncbi:MAG: DUF305 domain-containing protein [Vicinamibacterales bacterium]|jgi:uncharacterized protein (DUF305 family)